ncbi:MAG: AgmX/PglI C-terminal domain-containing protein, partial [Bacteriovoracaceae bacterium]
MDLQKDIAKKLFELKPLDTKHKVKAAVVGKGRILIGRSESCDVIINHDAVSAIHAVMEILDNKAVVYDMNSTNGSYVNDDRIIVKEIAIGDHVRFADVELVFKTYSPIDSLPPVLDTLEPSLGAASTMLPQMPELPATPKDHPKAPPVAPVISEKSIPSVVYPLNSDPKAEFSEYIFEDKEDLYPIFKYDSAKQAVEVIILFKDQVFSVDYIPEKNGTFFMSGFFEKENEVEFPYLGKKEKIPFIDIRSGIITLQTLPGYDVLVLGDKRKTTEHVATSIDLQPQDIVRLSKDDLQIYVRQVQSPPQVAHAPILKRDPDFRKYLFLFLFLAFGVSIGLNIIPENEEEKKKEEELAPERLAKILYKQPLTVAKTKAVEKTENVKKVVQKAPDRDAVKKDVKKETKEVVKKPDIMDIKNKVDKPDPGKKTAPEKQVVKKGPTPPKTPVPPKPSSAAPAKTTPAAAAGGATSQLAMKTAGHVEVYKSVDFSSTVSTMVAKGGSLSNVATKGAIGSTGSLAGAGTVSGVGTGTVKTATISADVGSLTGAADGKLGESAGAEGLSSKKAIYTAGIPAETVVLGSMDPDVIRRILMENLPQFRYCYQKELERTGQEVSGVVKLNFVIGASGNVSAAGVDGGSDIPGDVKRCVVGVLRGISFPEPMGGGTVEVKQPMNFYPKKIQ